MESKNADILLYDSMEDFNYEEYIDYCELNGIEPDAENSKGYWDWVYEQRDLRASDLQANLDYTRIDYPLMITGTLGLWYGHPDIVPVPIVSNGYGERVFHDGHKGYANPSLKIALNKCIRTCDDVDIHLEEGCIKVVGHHHDGRNVFYIRKLSKKGILAVESAERHGRECKPKDWWFCKIKLDEIEF